MAFKKFFISAILLGTALSAREDRGPQTFQDQEAQPQQQFQEIVTYLTPSQIKSLHSNEQSLMYDPRSKSMTIQKNGPNSEDQELQQQNPQEQQLNQQSFLPPNDIDEQELAAYQRLPTKEAQLFNPDRYFVDRTKKQRLQQADETRQQLQQSGQKQYDYDEEVKHVEEREQDSPANEKEWQLARDQESSNLQDQNLNQIKIDETANNQDWTVASQQQNQHEESINEQQGTLSQGWIPLQPQAQNEEPNIFETQSQGSQQQEPHKEFNKYSYLQRQVQNEELNNLHNLHQQVQKEKIKNLQQQADTEALDHLHHLADQAQNEELRNSQRDENHQDFLKQFNNEAQINQLEELQQQFQEHIQREFEQNNEQYYPRNQDRFELEQKLQSHRQSLILNGKELYENNHENLRPVTEVSEHHNQEFEPSMYAPKFNKDNYHIAKQISDIVKKNIEIEKIRSEALAAEIRNSPPIIVDREIKIIRHRPVTITRTNKVPTPYLVPIPSPYEVKVPHPYPVPLEIIKPFLVPIEKTEKIEIEKPVPYEVEKRVPVEVEKKIYVNVDKPYTVQRIVPVRITKKIPVEIPIYKPQKVTILKHVWKH